MARTIVQICGVSGERKFYGFEGSGGTALGQTDNVNKGALGNTNWCSVHGQFHASTEVVVDVPFEEADFKDPQGNLDPQWNKRFNALASQRADQILFRANQTGETVA